MLFSGFIAFKFNSVFICNDNRNQFNAKMSYNKETQRGIEKIILYYHEFNILFLNLKNRLSVIGTMREIDTKLEFSTID